MNAKLAVYLRWLILIGLVTPAAVICSGAPHLEPTEAAEKSRNPRNLRTMPKTYRVEIERGPEEAGELAYLEGRLREIIALLRSRDIDFHEGAFYDVTTIVGEAGFLPKHAALTYAHKYKLPTRVYVASLGGECPGTLVAATAEYGETRSYVSALPDGGGIAYAVVTGPLDYRSMVLAIEGECKKQRV